MTYTELVNKYNKETVDAAAAEYMLRIMWTSGAAEKVLKTSKKRNVARDMVLILAGSGIWSVLLVALNTYL